MKTTKDKSLRSKKSTRKRITEGSRKVGLDEEEE